MNKIGVLGCWFVEIHPRWRASQWLCALHGCCGVAGWIPSRCGRYEHGWTAHSLGQGHHHPKTEDVLVFFYNFSTFQYSVSIFLLDRLKFSRPIAGVELPRRRFYCILNVSPSGSRSSGRSCACRWACTRRGGQRWRDPADPWKPRMTLRLQRHSPRS